jgi:hypothetical protein
MPHAHIQKKGESLQEFIQCFCNKRNLILKVDDKLIIIFFKKRLRDSSLIHKLTMKNPRTLEQMLLSPTSIAWLRRQPSILESRRSQAARTSLARPRATTRRGKWTILSTQWSGHDSTRSIGPNRVNLKASWIAYAFSPPGKAQDLRLRSTPRFRRCSAQDGQKGRSRGKAQRAQG